MANETPKYQGSVGSNEARGLLRSLAAHHIYGVLRLDGSVDCTLTFIDGGLVLADAERPEDRIVNQGKMRQLLRSLVDGKGYTGSYVIEPVFDHHNAHTRPRFDLLAYLGEANGSDLAVRTVAVIPESTEATASKDTTVKDTTAVKDTTIVKDTTTVKEASPESDTDSKPVSAARAKVPEPQVPPAPEADEVRPRSEDSKPGGARAGDPPTSRRPMNPSNPDRPLRASQLRTLLHQPVDGASKSQSSAQGATRATGRPAHPQRSGSTTPDRTAKPTPPTIGPRVRASDRGSRDPNTTPDTKTTGEESTESGPQPNKRRALGRLIRSLAG